jgi:hypothetical protein
MIMSRKLTFSPRKRHRRTPNSANPNATAIGPCSVPTSRSHQRMGANASSAADNTSCAAKKPHQLAVTARV